LTSNGTRDLSDALRRRCLYAYVDYPDRDTELAILKAHPGIAETLDFAAALMGLGIADLTDNPAALQHTLSTLLKTQSDRASVTPEVAGRIAGRAA